MASGFNDYRKAVEVWWDDLARTMGAVAVESQPIYFVSSNPHSLPNLISGHVLTERDALVAFARTENPEGLADEWDALLARGDVGAQANYLYYIQRAYGKRDAAAHRSGRGPTRRRASTASMSRIRWTSPHR